MQEEICSLFLEYYQILIHDINGPSSKTSRSLTSHSSQISLLIALDSLNLKATQVYAIVSHEVEHKSSLELDKDAL